jgi:diadenosine tetraphosphate (Ap4A) HIT family hydrolase
MFDVRPARNALKLLRDKFNNSSHNLVIMLTQRTMHGRRVFDVHFFVNPSYETSPKWHGFLIIKLVAFRPAAALKPEALNP